MRAALSSSSVNVEVDAAPQEDMARVMEEIRSQYEGIVDKNRKEMDAWYKVKVRRKRRRRWEGFPSRVASKSLKLAKRTALSNTLSRLLNNKLTTKQICQPCLKKTWLTYYNPISHYCHGFHDAYSSDSHDPEHAVLLLQFDELNKVVTSNTQELQMAQQEISELKRTFQSLEIELQSQINLVKTSHTHTQIVNSALKHVTVTTHITHVSRLNSHLFFYNMTQ